jgi:hypothetical protein
MEKVINHHTEKTIRTEKTKRDGGHAKAKHIVPMHQHVQAPAVPPQLVYNNGPLLTAVQVTTIFWGAAWQQAAQSGLIPQLNSFFDFVLTSSLIDLIAEYSVPGQSIGHGSRIGTVNVTNSEPGGGGGQVSDAQIQTALQGWINGGTVAAANANTLYFIYLPPNVTVTDPQGGASCTQLCGYHWYIAGTNPQIYYAVMPFPSCNGCLGPLAQFDALTSTSSHELCEAITDAQPWSGWNDNNNGEIGDICAWQTGTLGGYTVQLEWSNAHNACSIDPGPRWLWANQGTPLGVNIAGAVGVLTMMDNPTAEQRPYAFVTGNDGNLWINWWDGGAWHWANQGTPQGANIAGAVGVLTMMDNPNAEQRPYAFVRGSDGHLWINWWDGGAWHWADQGTPQGANVTGAVGVLTMKDNPNAEQRPYAFVTGSDGNVWVDWWT